MNLQTLQELYFNHPGQKKMFDELALPGASKIVLKNLRDGARAFFFNAILKQSEYNHLIVLNDYEQAAYFHNDLEQISEALDIFYFPDSFKRRDDFAELNNSHVLLRTEALSKLQEIDKPKRKVLVTYPEALYEKVADADTIGKNILFIKKNEIIDLQNLSEFLIDLGFTKEEYAYEPGQFSLRGGIIDIFSFGNKHPYRIELFDNEVESIRLYDPETQLSVRQLLQVKIIPNVDFEKTKVHWQSLLEFLPKNTLVWCDDLSYCIEKIKKHHEKRINFEHKNEETNYKEKNFVEIDELISNFNKAKLIAFQEDSIRDVFQEEEEIIIPFQTQSQPAFNKKFELFIEHLLEKSAAFVPIYIFASNLQQIKRLEKIFEDLGHQITFTAINKGLSAGFYDKDINVLCYTDHQIFQRYHKYNIKQAFSKGQALTKRMLNELSAGDFVTHIDHGVGMYSGLQKIEVNGVWQEAVRIIYKDNDVLYVNINSLHKISKFTGKDGTLPKVHKLGSGTWEKIKNKTKKKIKEIAFDLIKLYAKRKAMKGHAFMPDNYLQTELEASFIYEDTPDQSKATMDVKQDMEKEAPMDRLICGDVGFGKTEIAIRAAFKAVCDNKQVAILVPTTILAYQHYQNFTERLSDFPCNVDYLNRFKSAREKKESLQKLAEGKTDIFIATHALLSKDVKFKSLGLLVIDEEQKFGVAAKEKIRNISSAIDTLTLTATPIPRTLQFSLMGARDLSIINTPPPNRQPVETEVRLFQEELIRDAIYFETERKGQVFFVHNRVKDLDEMRILLQNLCPDVRFRMAHGQMAGNELEETILAFVAHEFDVLVSTNIVESGVDIPNANTIIVNHAHQFGLSDLHQLRGRVGRSNKKAFCYLLAPPASLLPDESRKRLQSLEQFSDLGSGFQIAMRDLDIRGAGNILGGEQSGFIADIGLETYQKILNDAIRELKQNEFKDEFEQDENLQDYISDCVVDADVEMLIPDSYVESIQERFYLYNRLDRIENEESLQEFKTELIDRFGPLPENVENLFQALRCRWLAIHLGFERFIFRKNQIRFYFISNPESPYFKSPTFEKILHFIQHKTAKARLKNVGKQFMLIIEKVKDLDEALWYLNAMME